MKLKLAFLAALAALALSAGMAQAQSATPGVSKNEIVLGTILDQSGPLASNGKQFRMGLQLRVDEANEMGGVHGRKIKLLVEDDNYDPKKSVLATQKLIGQGNGIFAVIGRMGTAMNNASMPVQFEKNVINFLPYAAARSMSEPPHPLKWANQPSQYDQARVAAPRLMKQNNLSKACILYQDDDFGAEVLQGAEAGLKTIGKEFVEKTSYKRGATDFSTQVAKMKSAGCELVVLGTIVRETVGAIVEARKAGFNPLFVGSSAVYNEQVIKLGGKPVEGLYAAMTAAHPYLDAAEQPVRSWARKYQTKYNEDPTVNSASGWGAMDAFLKVAFKVGPNLTTDAFVKTMETMTFPPDMFGMAELTFSPTKHLGNQFSRLSQIQDGRWKVVSDYVAFSGLKSVKDKDGKLVVQSEFFKDR
ncbi:ABC transporter substrate-binding protein [Aquincola sp. S2]|uniref:ABC transporter substrate-binding protein n=1 Tax=Pseudaquabacterium terrae TaxID=2732868 RepID=A0ABX2ERR2_9BURK|nr:ABC transporter substrate-binding protein [Aquabacterium terrae]NRF71341.1 ABC transporter substrate-binding protein [Aquabacterium terrae]